MGTLLTKLGPVLVLGLFFLAELLAALFLFSFWQRLKAVQKKNKRESSAQIQGDELLLKKTKAALLTLRLSDAMPLAMSRSFSTLTGLSFSQLQGDIRKLMELADPAESRAFYKRYKEWDGKTRLCQEFRAAATGRWLRLTVERSTDQKSDLFLFEDWTENEQRLRALEAQLEEAQKASQSKTTFLSKMSHEIRTPMNGIVGMLTLAHHALDENAPAIVYLHKAEELVQYMLSLINDILDMSRIEAGRIELEEKVFDIGDLAEKMRSLFQKNIESKGVRFIVEQLDFDVHNLIGDELRISQVVINFISNAMKFTGKGDRISVSVTQLAHQDAAKYKIVVEDTGVGMSEDFLPQLFEPYARETRFGVKKVAGTGLGMPIVKNLVTQMSGQIYVDSEAGKGTTFTIVIPFTAVKEEKEEKKEQPAGLPGTSLEGKTVLLAEDNEVNMEIATEILTMSGIKILQAWNGLEAVERFKESPPFSIDAILMDMQMPRMDGCEAARTIRALPRPDAGTVPVIAVTANAFAEDIAATTAAGMNAHVSKPIDFAVLLQTLEELTGGQGGGRIP